MHSPADPRNVLFAAAERLLDWRFHCWYWGDAVAIDGLLEAHDVIGGPYRQHVLDALLRWQAHCPVNFDDVLAPGAAILRLVMAGDLPSAAADRLLRSLDGLPSAIGAVPGLEPHRPAFRFGLCIDTLYHLPPLFALAGRLRGDTALSRRAIDIALDGMQALRCAAGWAQWFDPTRHANNGVAWSRGLGWAVLGLLDLLSVVDRPVSEVSDLAAQLLTRLAQTQEEDGHWRAVLDHPAAATETSTAAFYVAACRHPAAQNLVALPSHVLKRAELALIAAIDADGTYTGVSADVLPSWDIKTYERFATEPSPWAQGSAVRALAALARAADQKP